MERKIYHYEQIDSTNIKAKELAPFENEGTVIIADEQTMGKGRLGRSWVSYKGKGIYMSMILKPKMDIAKVSRITLIGAAAVHLALNDMGIESKIKWPNDILVGDKKVCGILTEISGDINKVNLVIMGIGININLDEYDIPAELRDKATSLKIYTGKSINKEGIFGLLLDYFEELYIPFKGKGELSHVLDICRNNSSVIGREIKVIKGDYIRIGEALDINEDGELIVKFEEGIEAINSGEVSVR